MQELNMKTRQAIKFILKKNGLTKYALAQEIGCNPTSINQWERRTRMSKAYANIVYRKFKVVVTDAC